MDHQNIKVSKMRYVDRKIKNDVIFILALISILTVVGLGFMLFMNEGNTVTVSVNGEILQTYPLDKDRSVEIITGDNNESFNLLVIKDSKASVTSASCPDGICASHKPIYREGESIVCLPNRVVITVKNTSGSESLDIIS